MTVASATLLILPLGLLLLGAQYKLRSPMLAALSIVDFGLSRHPSPRLARTIAVCELVLVALVLAAIAVGPQSLHIISLAALTLVNMGFLALHLIALVRGRAFPCHCTNGHDLAGWDGAIKASCAAVASAVATVSQFDGLHVGRMSLLTVAAVTGALAVSPSIYQRVSRQASLSFGRVSPRVWS